LVNNLMGNGVAPPSWRKSAAQKDRTRNARRLTIGPKGIDLVEAEANQ